jgi:hypothetical protein
MPFEVLALILTGAAAALAQRYLTNARKTDTRLRERDLAPVRVRVQQPVVRRRSR